MNFISETIGAGEPDWSTVAALRKCIKERIDPPVPIQEYIDNGPVETDMGLWEDAVYWTAYAHEQGGRPQVADWLTQYFDAIVKALETRKDFDEFEGRLQDCIDGAFHHLAWLEPDFELPASGRCYLPHINVDSRRMLEARYQDLRPGYKYAPKDLETYLNGFQAYPHKEPDRHEWHMQALFEVCLTSIRILKGDPLADIGAGQVDRLLG